MKFVNDGDFGLASGPRPGGTYDRVWYHEPVAPEEVSFDPQVFLLTRQRAAALKAPPVSPPAPPGPPEPPLPTEGGASGEGGQQPTGALGTSVPAVARLRLQGPIPPEVWNRLGNRLLPKLRTGQNLTLTVDATFEVSLTDAPHAERELRQVLTDLGLSDKVRVITESTT